MYEIHVTIDAEGVDLQEFAAVCERIGAKPVSLALHAQKGDLTDLMATSTVASCISLEVDRLWAALASEGYNPIRYKIEVPLDHLAVPRECNALEVPRGRYFEAHLLVQTGQVMKLRNLCAANKVHLSSTPKKEGYYWVTKRSRLGTAELFTAAVRWLEYDLYCSSLYVADRRLEFVMTDSNYKHDERWTNG